MKKIKDDTGILMRAGFSLFFSALLLSIAVGTPQDRLQLYGEMSVSDISASPEVQSKIVRYANQAVLLIKTPVAGL
jgi:hypothetical protein